MTIVNLISKKLVEHIDLAPFCDDPVWDYSPDDFLHICHRESGIMKFVIESEGNNIWMLLLEKKMYKEAFDLVERHKPEFRDQLASKLADHYVENKNFEGAVALWSRIDYPFEMAAMTLLDFMSTELKARTAFIKLLENYVR